MSVQSVFETKASFNTTQTFTGTATDSEQVNVLTISLPAGKWYLSAQGSFLVQSGSLQGAAISLSADGQPTFTAGVSDGLILTPFDESIYTPLAQFTTQGIMFSEVAFDVTVTMTTFAAVGGAVTLLGDNDLLVGSYLKAICL